MNSFDVGIGVLINKWYIENKDKSAKFLTRNLLSYLFKTLDLLYVATERMPETLAPPSVSIRDGIRVSSKHGLYSMFPTNGENMLLLYSAINLTGGDCRDILDVLLGTKNDTGNLLELRPPLEKMLEIAERFRSCRNFFSHLGDHLSNFKSHSISGEHNVSNLIHYTSEAEENVHLWFTGNKIYFSHRREAMEADVSREAFRALLVASRLVYSKVVSDREGKRLPSPNSLYRPLKITPGLPPPSR